MGNRASTGNHAGRFPLPSPSPDAQASNAASSRAGRVFVLRHESKPQSTFREINQERDIRFQEVVKRTQEGEKKKVRVRKVRPDLEGNASSAACHCDISRRNSADERISVPPFPKKVRLAVFQRGVLVVGKSAPLAAKGGKRGIVSEFSLGSRLRCSWSFLNAETEWLAMVTLTYPSDPDPEACRGHLRAWLSRINRAYPGKMDIGWVIEGTKGGRPHFHVFFGDGGFAGKAIDSEPHCTVIRKGKSYRVCRGPFESVCVESWLSILKKNVCCEEWSKVEAFQRGGIVELLNSSDAAARYVSKEASKRAQKGENVNLGKGCFWRLSRHLKARSRGVYGVTKPGLKSLPSFSRIFDREAALSLADFNSFTDSDEMTEKDLKESIRASKKETVASLKVHIRANKNSDVMADIQLSKLEKMEVDRRKKLGLPEL